MLTSARPENVMIRICLWTALSLATILATGGTASSQVKVPYPQVRIQIGPTFTPDAAFARFRKQFLAAVENQDLKALSVLVAPGFVWTVNTVLSVDYDTGRDPQHNFRVLFGFRAAGEDEDGDIADGAWDVLKGFAEDDSLHELDDGGNLICSPNSATIVSTEVYERASNIINEAVNDPSWFFTLRPTPVTNTHGGAGTPIGKIGTEAFPVVSRYPAKADKPTHLEILLPSGRRGWIPASVARPLQGDRLCYVRTRNGDWKIGVFDGLASDDE